MDKGGDNEEQITGVIELCSGYDPDDNPFFVYIEIRPDMFEEYLWRHRKKLPLELTDYGTILYRGDGLQPDAALKAELEAKFGINHNFEKDLDKEIIKQKSQKL